MEQRIQILDEKSRHLHALNSVGAIHLFIVIVQLVVRHEFYQSS